MKRFLRLALNQGPSLEPRMFWNGKSLFTTFNPSYPFSEDGDDRTMNEDEAVQESESVMELNRICLRLSNTRISPSVHIQNPLAAADESASNDEFFGEGPTRTFDETICRAGRAVLSSLGSAKSNPRWPTKPPAPAVAAHSGRQLIGKQRVQRDHDQSRNPVQVAAKSFLEQPRFR